MRFLLSIALGIVVGAILGIAVPFAMYFYHRVSNPGPDGGVGTVFGMMLILTVPGFAALGAIFGTIIGALRD